MALFSMATDLQTRQIVWVSRNVVKGRPQLNSHRPDALGQAMARAGIDGYSAAELAGMHTDYQGNG
jgi:hypothetical protein